MLDTNFKISTLVQYIYRCSLLILFTHTFILAYSSKVLSNKIEVLENETAYLRNQRSIAVTQYVPTILKLEQAQEVTALEIGDLSRRIRLLEKPDDLLLEEAE